MTRPALLLTLRRRRGHHAAAGEDLKEKIHDTFSGAPPPPLVAAAAAGGHRRPLLLPALRLLWRGRIAAGCAIRLRMQLQIYYCVQAASVKPSDLGSYFSATKKEPLRRPRQKTTIFFLNESCWRPPVAGKDTS